LVVWPELEPELAGALVAVPDAAVLVADPDAAVVELLLAHTPTNHFWILSSPLGSLGQALLQTLRVEV